MSGAAVTAIVLAAGASRRMGGENKLLLPLAEGTVVEQVVRALLEAGVPDVVVVTGHQWERVEAALRAYPVRPAFNPDHAEGMASSIRQGVRSAPEAAGYLICPGDMPFIRSRHVARLVEVFGRWPGPAIVVAASGGRRGHPVLFHAAFREALLGLAGDGGARPVLQANPSAVVEVEMADDGILTDLDTPEAYRAARTRHAP